MFSHSALRKNSKGGYPQDQDALGGRIEDVNAAFQEFFLTIKLDTS